MSRRIGKRHFLASDRSITMELLDVLDPDTTFVSMIGGNVHNAVGLVEREPKFDFSNLVDEDLTDRERIPFYVVRDVLRDKLNGYLRHLTDFSKHFRGRKYHLAAPPVPKVNPIDVASHKDLSGVAISPDVLRKKLYRETAYLTKLHCRQCGVVYIDPPKQSLDEDGYLKRDLWGNDPTHANSKYGSMLIEQLKEVVA